MCEVFVPRVCEIWLLCCRFRSHELLGSVAPFLLTYYYTRAPLNYQQHPAYSSESYHDDGYHYDDASTTTTATSPAAAAATTTTKTTPAPFRIQNIRPPPPNVLLGRQRPNQQCGRRVLPGLGQSLVWSETDSFSAESCLYRA